MMYPSINPKRCKVITEIIIFIPDWKMISFPSPIILATIKTINKTETDGE